MREHGLIDRYREYLRFHLRTAPGRCACLNQDDRSILIHTFLVINDSHIIKLRAVLFDKGLMGRIVGHVIVTILLGYKLDHEAVRETTLDVRGRSINTERQPRVFRFFIPEPLLDYCQHPLMKR